MAEEAVEQHWCPELGSCEREYSVYRELANWIEGKASESMAGPGRRAAVKLLVEV